MSNSLLRFTKKAMLFWRNQFAPIEEHTRRTATATEGIHAARGRGTGIVIEGADGGQPVAVTFDESGAQPVTSEQLPPELGPGGGTPIEGVLDGVPVTVRLDTAPPSPATWASGRLAFGSITSAYVIVLAPANPARLLALFNSTDTEVVVSFDNGTAHGYMPAFSAWDVPLRMAGVSEVRAVYVKHNGTAPLSGAVAANAVL